MEFLFLPSKKRGLCLHSSQSILLCAPGVAFRSHVVSICTRILLLVVTAGTSLASGQTRAGQPAVDAPEATSSGSIRGVVEGKDGEVYEGVRVTLSRGGAGQSSETDTAGEFFFEQVAPGLFTLTFSSQGFETENFSGELHSGEVFTVPNVVMGFKKSVSEVRVSAEQQVLIAEQQIHIEEHQRVLGVLPNYYVSYARDPMPLTSRQKFKLAWHSNVDPFNWFMNAGFAGIQQGTNSFKGYGQGMQGYGKRMGADTADSFFGNMIGGAIFPSFFHQDPRYFYKGIGTIRARIGYALANTVICRGDNMHWQFNFSGILGGLAAGGISNLYYPDNERSDAVVTFEGAGIGLAGSAVQNLFQEFLIKKLTPHANRSDVQ